MPLVRSTELGQPSSYYAFAHKFIKLSHSSTINKTELGPQGATKSKRRCLSFEPVGVSRGSFHLASIRGVICHLALVSLMRLSSANLSS